MGCPDTPCPPCLRTSVQGTPKPGPGCLFALHQPPWTSSGRPPLGRPGNEDHRGWVTLPRSLRRNGQNLDLAPGLLNSECKDPGRQGRVARTGQRVPNHSPARERPGRTQAFSSEPTKRFPAWGLVTAGDVLLRCHLLHRGLGPQGHGNGGG